MAKDNRAFSKASPSAAAKTARAKSTRGGATAKPCPAESALYFSDNGITIYNADILDLKARDLSNASIDLIVTSPPYNLGSAYSSSEDAQEYQDYLTWTKKWLSTCYRLSKDTGRFCLNIPLDKNKGGQKAVCAEITRLAQEVGWHYHATIIWNEGNISRRTAWGSWLSASAL